MFVNEQLLNKYQNWPYDRKVVPAYLKELRPKLEQEQGRTLPYARIQRYIVRNKVHLNGEPFVEHVIRFMQYLWPDMDFDPWRIDMIKHFVYCWQNGIKEYSIHGASNCRKTSTMAMVVCAVYWIDPKFTTIYITSPFKEASQTGLFSAVIEAFVEAKERHPWLPGTHIASKYEIRLDPSRHPRSFIKVATVDTLGKMIGKKPKDAGKGIMLMVCDEAPEMEDRPLEAFTTLLTNMKSLKNFMVWTAGNFKKVDDLLGLLSEPDLENGYNSLNEETSNGWKTVRGGICRRYNGELSPNVLLGYERYIGLNTVDYCDEVAADGGGRKSPDYYRFILSFPVLDLDEYTILNLTKIHKGGGYADPAWAGRGKERYAFCDPGWGGDPCAIQMVERGTAMFVNAQGQTTERDHLHISQDMFKIPIIVPSVNDEDTKAVDEQIVRACVDFCEKHKIPHRNFGFDGSLRSGIVHAFATEDPAFVPIDNLGKASEKIKRRIVIGSKTITKKGVDMYADYNTEQHFDTASLVVGGQLSGLQNVKSTVKELCRRRWDFAGKKKIIQSKRKYKEDNRGKSPTGADTTVGAVQMAIRRGFKIAEIEAMRTLNNTYAQRLIEARKKKLAKKFFGRGIGEQSRRPHKLSRMAS